MINNIRPTMITGHRMNPIHFQVADGKLKGIRLVRFEFTLSTRFEFTLSTVKSCCLKSTLGFKELSKQFNRNFENG